MTDAADVLLTGAAERLALAPATGDGPLGVVRDGAVAARGGRVVAVGRTADVARQGAPGAGAAEGDARRRVVRPGLLDSHTHLLFAGPRGVPDHRHVPCLLGVDHVATVVKAGRPACPA